MPHVAAMLYSLLRQHPAQVHVHFLYDAGLPSPELSRLKDFVVGLAGQWTGHLISEAQRAKFPDNYHFGREAWYRILLPELLTAESRVLYLDADTIIRRSLMPLWQMPLDGKVLGAICNPLYGFMNTRFMAGLGVTTPAEYFNSGVLLIDLDRWRAEGISQQMFRFIKERGSQQSWPDQNALNCVLAGRWQRLSPAWNLQNVYYDLPLKRIPYPPEVVRDARANPAIVHYSAPYKPWDYLCKHRFQFLYLQHVAATPWGVPELRGRNWKTRILRLLPQPLMWISGVYLNRLWLRLRRV